VEALVIDDLVMSARRGKLIVRDGKGGIYREVPLHHTARVALRAWLNVPAFPRGADDTRRRARSLDRPDPSGVTNGPVSAASPIRNPPPRRQFW
jgi:hypothetical protein